MSSKTFQPLFVLLMVLFTTACTSVSEQQQAATTNQLAAPDKPAFDDVYVDERDPFESMNRVLWDFNWDVLDKYLLRPIAVGYTKLPQPAQTGVRNFITNLEEPGYAINSLLQGKVVDSGTGVGRFVVNSTIGVFGLFDVAKYIGLEQKKESFGETMAVAGIGNGPFFMVPAYGPTTVRDGTGDFVDGLIFPLSLFSLPQSILKTGIKAIYTRADLIQQESLINQSTDKYIFIKEAYFQSQAYKVYDGNPPIPEPKFDDSFLDEID